MTITTDSVSLSRYNVGVTTILHKNKIVTTTLGSAYDLFVRDLNLKKGKRGRVPAMFAHRPDLISNVFYDSPGYWWYAMQYNGLTDPFEELNPGDNIFIPEL